VWAELNYILPDNVETLVLLGAAHWGAGNASDNRLYGNDGADTLIGAAGGDTLAGGAGDDYFDGGDGNDALYGEAGNDVLVGSAGADTLAGSVGDDVYVVDAGDVVVENAGEGVDRIVTALASFSLAGLAAIENLSGTGTSGQALSGNDLANAILGGSGNDTLNGGLGSDALDGRAGIDQSTTTARCRGSRSTSTPDRRPTVRRPTRC
jgi:trimeric autotransporter adhesin